MSKIIFSFFLLLLSFKVFAQAPTLGLLFSGNNISDGYTLFTPEENQTVYLINNCGELVRKWDFFELPGATCYLLENGNLLRAGKDSLTVHDWDDNLVWSFPTSANGINQNHDIEPLPNGNVLCVVSKQIPAAQIIAQGRDPNLVTGPIKIEKIVEIMPVGLNGGTVVWEWNFINHFIQDFDSTKSNYGVVGDHPELLDVNLNNGFPSDWTHVNSVDYNVALDQILVSARNMNEIYIIDHSTTTAEAASHSGGNSGKGGDFLWRWGNPEVYRHGTISDRKLFLQHDAKWVDTGYLDEGKITVFSNGVDTSQNSYVHIITPTIVSGEYTSLNYVFNPPDFEWSWSGSILGHVVLQPVKSGIQSQPNGNVIVSEAAIGQISEISKMGDLLWSYKNPSGSIIYNQFDIIPNSYNTIYKAERYPPDFPGFVGKDLTPQGIIENQNSISQACVSSYMNYYMNMDEISVENPVKNNRIRFNKIISLQSIHIKNLNGMLVYSNGIFNGDQLFVDLNPGMYILQLTTKSGIIDHKIIVQ